MSSTNDDRGSEPVRNTSALYGGSSEPDEAAVTVRQASVLLGISERAVLKRIQQGTLRARKSDRQWEVWLTSSSELGSEPSVLSSEPMTGSAEPVQVDQTPLLDQLQSEVQFLRTEIERRNQAEGELRRLMLTDRQEIARLRDQLAITAAPTDVPEAFVDAPGEHDGFQSGPAEDRAQNSAEKRKARWWHLWERKG